MASYKKSFDWMNTGWQSCSLYLPLEFEKETEGEEPRVIRFAKNDIETIKFYFDYSHNTGNAIYEEMSQHSDTDEWNFDIDSQFDTDGNVTNTTFTINGVAQQYEYVYSDDPDAKLEAVSLPNGAVQTLDYDKLSRVHKVELNVADGTLEHREYEYLKVGDHTSNLVSKLKFARDGVQREMLRYKYDEKGNITEIRENNTLLARYKYDGLSRLIREDNKEFSKTTTFELFKYCHNFGGDGDFPKNIKSAFVRI